jgi:hypothetical protein
MVEGLTFFSGPTKGSCERQFVGVHRVVATTRSRAGRIEVHFDSNAAAVRPTAPITSSPHQTHEILVTPAERPYPFPSRTRKSSSPAPKILRGQPLGKIGRRRGLLRFRRGADRPGALIGVATVG